MAGRLNAPLVNEIEGLSPSIAIEQKGLPHNPPGPRSEHLPRYTITCGFFSRGWVRSFALTAICPCGPGRSPISCATFRRPCPRRAGYWSLPPLARSGKRTCPICSKGSGGMVSAGYAPRDRSMSWTLFLRYPAGRPTGLKLSLTGSCWMKRSRGGSSDSLELALRVGKGTAGVATPEGAEKFYSESARCASCGYTGPELSPSLFSFQHPSGMCPVCRGLGYTGADTTRPPVGNAFHCGGHRRSRTSRVQLGAPTLSRLHGNEAE